MADTPGAGSKAQSTGAPAGRAPDGMLALGLVGVLVLGGFVAFALIASIG
ncbi:hypothetical protein J8J14_11840 [Roseomonas sp. SSH11]|uniref:Uncharacterized protein n=1 Tax=Pararoseomonas baculiformis TaxID=2820812 RepID=A0ABS4AEN8_9PROT|nr:hypothetical protein [Pararoseomonas baculiformis]MBP0445469.1 hypothetical protein [Pararoseomonas baculiformis]